MENIAINEKKREGIEIQIERGIEQRRADQSEVERIKAEELMAGMSRVGTVGRVGVGVNDQIGYRVLNEGNRCSSLVMHP